MSDHEAVRKQAQAAAEDFMKRCDTNNDGVVEFEEVRAKFGADWSEDKLAKEKARFDSMDTNKDGKVDKKEFEDWIFEMMPKE